MNTSDNKLLKFDFHYERTIQSLKQTKPEIVDLYNKLYEFINKYYAKRNTSNDFDFLKILLWNGGVNLLKRDNRSSNDIIAKNLKAYCDFIEYAFESMLKSRLSLPDKEVKLSAYINVLENKRMINPLNWFDFLFLPFVDWNKYLKGHASKGYDYMWVAYFSFIKERTVRNSERDAQLDILKTLAKGYEEAVKSNKELQMDKAGLYNQIMILEEKKNERDKDILSELSKYNIFKKFTGGWIIAFEGDVCILNDRIGLSALHYLFANPERVFNANEILRELGYSAQLDQTAKTLSNLSKEELSNQESLSEVEGILSAEPLTDKKTIMSLLSKKAELENDIDNEYILSDSRKEKMQREVDAIQKFLNDLTTPTGKIKYSEPTNSATLRKNIKNAILAIKNKNLTSHLENYGKFYREFRYYPPKQTDWLL